MSNEKKSDSPIIINDTKTRIEKINDFINKNNRGIKKVKWAKPYKKHQP